MIQPAQAGGTLEGVRPSRPALRRAAMDGLVLADAGVESLGCTPTLLAAED